MELEGMVHALEIVHDLLKPGGVLVDIHPNGDPPPIEVNVGGDVMLAGYLDETDDFEEYFKADEALAEVTGTGLDILVLGQGAKAAVEGKLGAGAGTLYVSEADAVADYTAEAHAAAAKAVIEANGATDYMLSQEFQHPPTPEGRQPTGLYPYSIRQEYGENRAPIDCFACHY